MMHSATTRPVSGRVPRALLDDERRGGIVISRDPPPVGPKLHQHQKLPIAAQVASRRFGRGTARGTSVACAGPQRDEMQDATGISSPAAPANQSKVSRWKKGRIIRGRSVIQVVDI